MTQTPQQFELIPKPHRNHYLFSDYYLDRRVQTRLEWNAVDVRVAFAEM